MRTPSLFLLLLSLHLWAQGPAPVKRPVLPLLNEVVIDVPSGTAARERCDVNGVCEASKAGDAMDEKLAALATERAGIGPGGANQVTVQQMQDPAFQERMKYMSQEELIAMAQQMRQSAPGGSLPMGSIGTSEEHALMEEYQRLLPDQTSFISGLSDEMSAAFNTLKDKLDKLEAAELEAINGCPKVRSGEMTVTDPACCDKIHRSFREKKNAALAEWLAGATTLLHGQRDRIHARFKNSEQRLADVGYGDKVTSQAYWNMASDLQTQLTGAISYLQSVAGDLWRRVCEAQLRIDREMNCL
jgi:hypothetical protein